jgi:hypothetical protein
MGTACARHGHGMGTAWARHGHGMGTAWCTAWARHGHGMGTACARQAVDTDDGSAFYKTYENFFVYAANGLKSDFNGRNNEHYRNVYGYVDSCWGPSRPWLHTGESNIFSDNWCVANAADGGFASGCDKPKGVVVSRNKVFSRDGHFAAGEP